MKFPRPAVFAAGAVTALVLGSGTAFAATGGTFILGKSNTAKSATTLKNPKGTPLRLISKAGTPSFRVSSKTKVPRLNADRLDGLSSGSFALAGGQTNTVPGTTFPVDADEDGTDDFLVSIATCPAGTKLTGGGGEDYSDGGSLFANSPLDKMSWYAASSTTDLTATDAVTAYAVCYNPRGAVRGLFRTAPAKPSTNARDLVKQRLAPKLG